MIFIIVYIVVGYVTAISYISTIEGQEIYSSLDEHDRTSFFMEITFYWPKYIFKL